MNEINFLLEQDMTLNKKHHWNKLDKTIKLKKLNEYSLLFCRKNNITDEVILGKLKDFLKMKLNQRQFNTNKDVNYDINKSQIINIPNLVYENGKFLLQRNESRHSTIKCLTPTKKN